MEDFEQLYGLYSKQLYNYLFYMSRNRHFAEELLQETYYRALKSIYRFRGESKVITWLVVQHFEIGLKSKLKLLQI